MLSRSTTSCKNTPMARPPVTDWANDFDHFDPAWTIDPAQIWAELREHCPVATSQRFEGGAYLPLRYADIYAIAYDTEHFSSQRIVVREQKIPIKGMPPITSDPPEHTAARRLLLPAFSPKEVQKLEPRIREICRTLLSAMDGNTHVDAATDYAQQIPLLVTADMLGVSASDGDLFRKWIYQLGTESVHDPMSGMQAIEEIGVFFGEHMEHRRLHPADDLITFLVRADIDGIPLSDRHIIGTLTLILVAGIETTWSSIGAALWHLATHPDDRRRLVAEPELLPTAIEEFLRVSAPVTMAREVVKDTTVGGCPYAKGGQVLLSYAAANRDPDKFDNADKVLIDRATNPHAAFGLGRHRCLGSNLARLEMTIAIEEWLRCFPEFELQAGHQVTWSEGQLRGPKVLPLHVLHCGSQICLQNSESDPAT